MCIEQTVRCKWHADAVIDDVKKCFYLQEGHHNPFLPKLKTPKMKMQLVSNLNYIRYKTQNYSVEHVFISGKVK